MRSPHVPYNITPLKRPVKRGVDFVARHDSLLTAGDAIVRSLGQRIPLR